MEGYVKFFGTEEQPNLPSCSVAQVAGLANQVSPAPKSPLRRIDTTIWLARILANTKPNSCKTIDLIHKCGIGWGTWTLIQFTLSN